MINELYPNLCKMLDEWKNPKSFKGAMAELLKPYLDELESLLWPDKYQGKYYDHCPWSPEVSKAIDEAYYNGYSAGFGKRHVMDAQEERIEDQIRAGAAMDNYERGYKEGRVNTLEGMLHYVNKGMGR